MTLIWAGLASVGGTLSIGPLFDRLNGFLLLTVCLTMQAVAISLAPLWPSLVAYQAMSAIAFVFNFALMSGMTSLDSRHVLRALTCIDAFRSSIT
jgi:predicted MFS family arabinose efflux permease